MAAGQSQGRRFATNLPVRVSCQPRDHWALDEIRRHGQDAGIRRPDQPRPIGDSDDVPHARRSAMEMFGEDLA